MYKIHQYHFSENFSHTFKVNEMDQLDFTYSLLSVSWFSLTELVTK